MITDPLQLRNAAKAKDAENFRFRQDEVQRLAGYLGTSETEFAQKYLQPAEGGEDNPWAIRDCPCPFLKDKRCTAYQLRPANCRHYPYLDKPQFTRRTLSMMDRLSDCPAVFEVWEQLKQATRFHHRR